MIHIRLIRPCRREFERDVYTPGVISLSRIAWGSVGSGLFLLLIALLSRVFLVPVLLAPLAATCFISATCVYLRVARPKAVIVGHFVSTIAGLIAVLAGSGLPTSSDLAIPFKLGFALLLAALFMQALDADHPPAAATAAIPVILPLPEGVSAWFLPAHMAWGGVLAVLAAIVWNRVWFEYPAAEPGAAPAPSSWRSVRRWWPLRSLNRFDAIGFSMCVAAFALMCLRRWSAAAYEAGLVIMMAGALTMAVHHFFGAQVITRATESLALCESPDKTDTAAIDDTPSNDCIPITTERR